MKFSRDANPASPQSHWSNKRPKHLNVMVDNFVKDSSDQQLSRSKSVLFSRSSTGCTESKYRDSEIDLLSSPKSDSSSKISRYKRDSITAQDDIDFNKLRRQSRSLSISSDDAAMDDNASMKSGWKMFEENIKSIDDTTEYFLQIPKPSFKSSDAFQKVMVDLYGNPEYGQKIGYTQLRGKVGNITAMTSRMMTRRRAKKDEEKIHEDELDNVKLPPSKTTIDNAKRGWIILRRHVQDRISERKSKVSNLQWTMLGQTLRAMSNTDKTRLDLYQRYGLIPKLNNEGQYVAENSMLSERARSLLKSVANPNSLDEEVNSKSPLRARSSFLPRCLPVNTNTSKQRMYYTLQRAVSSRPKPI